MIERIVEALRDRPRARLDGRRSPPPQPRDGPRRRPSSPPRSRSASTCPRPSGPPSWPRRGGTPAPRARRSARARRRWSSGARRRCRSRPLSYTAISAYEDCAYRFYMERVLGLGSDGRGGASDGRRRRRSAREERAARGSAVHALLEWSQANGWREPPAELARRHALAEGLEPDADGLAEEPARRRSAAGSAPTCFASGSAPAARRSGPRCRSCSSVAGTVLRGSIDLLVERDGRAAAGRRLQDRPPRRRRPGRARRPLRDPARRSTRSPSPRRAARRRSRSPTSSSSAPRSRSSPASAPAEMEAGRERLATRSPGSARGEFPVAAPERAQLGPVPRLPGARPPLLGPRGLAGSASSFAASSSSLSSFRPSPTASSSAAQ